MFDLIWMAVGVLALIGTFQLSHVEWSNAAAGPAPVPAHVLSLVASPGLARCRIEAGRGAEPTNVSHWQVGLVPIAGLAHLRLFPDVRAADTAAIRLRPGVPMLRPAASAAATASPTQLAPAGSPVDWNAP